MSAKFFGRELVVLPERVSPKVPHRPLELDPNANVKELPPEAGGRDLGERDATENGCYNYPLISAKW